MLYVCIPMMLDEKNLYSREQNHRAPESGERLQVYPDAWGFSVLPRLSCVEVKGTDYLCRSTL